jgi:hypothetical protein
MWSSRGSRGKGPNELRIRELCSAELAQIRDDEKLIRRGASLQNLILGFDRGFLSCCHV